MIHVYSGDPYLARRAYLRGIRDAQATGCEVLRLGEGADAAALSDALAQGGLFGAVVVAIDVDEAAAGAGGGATALRGALIGVLEAAGDDTAALVLDSAATPSRQKRYRGFADLHHQPTPRYGQLQRWVRSELEASGLEARGDVAGTLVDLFGDDVPGIAAEIEKLRSFGEPLDPDLIRRIANRPAARSAFDMVDAIVAGDNAAALGLANGLVEAGEAPVRVMAALGYQLDLIAGCVGLQSRGDTVSAEAAASALKAPVFPTRKALAVAGRLDEARLQPLLDAFVRADERMKVGGDPVWHLHACVMALAEALADAGARRGG